MRGKTYMIAMRKRGVFFAAVAAEAPAAGGGADADADGARSCGSAAACRSGLGRGRGRGRALGSTVAIAGARSEGGRGTAGLRSACACACVCRTVSLPAPAVCAAGVSTDGRASFSVSSSLPSSSVSARAFTVTPAFSLSAFARPLEDDGRKRRGSWRDLRRALCAVPLMPAEAAEAVEGRAADESVPLFRVVLARGTGASPGGVGAEAEAEAGWAARWSRDAFWPMASF